MDLHNKTAASTDDESPQFVHGLGVNALVEMGPGRSARFGRVSVGTTDDAVYVHHGALEMPHFWLLKPADASLLADVLTSTANIAAGRRGGAKRATTRLEVSARGRHVHSGPFADDPLAVAVSAPPACPGLAGVVVGAPYAYVTFDDALLLAEEVAGLAEELSICGCGCGRPR